MNKAQWMAAVMRAAGEMPKYERELCQLDTLVGDGDHGVTVSRGFRSVVQRILVEETTELSDFCSRVGEGSLRAWAARSARSTACSGRKWPRRCRAAGM